MPSLTRSWFLVLLVILLCAGYWRFTNLGHDSFWHDEIFTVEDAQKGLNGFSDPHHAPLLHILTYTSFTLFGENEITARLPSALAGLLGVGLLALLGAVMGHPRAGLWAAFLLALLPFHVQYSQEARYYALLLALSLLTFITLYLAVTRRTLVWWASFGLATALNLYTHYGALLVLGWQVIFLAGWILWRGTHREIRAVQGPLLAGVVALLLYAPWLVRASQGIIMNMGDTATEGAGDFSPLSIWVQTLFYDFGFGYTADILPFVVATLGIIGLAVLAIRRQWLPFCFVLLGLVMPVVLILSLDVARSALAKYVIFVLPFYLLAAGVGIDSLLRSTSQIQPLRRHGYLLLATIIILWVGWRTVPLLQQSHAYVYQDWRSVVDAIAANATEGDTIVSLALDLPDGYNEGAKVLPYYLDQHLDNYHFLASSQLSLDGLKYLLTNENRVWLVLYNRVNPVQFTDGTASVQSFQGPLYLVQPNTGEKPLAQLIEMYTQMVPMTPDPAPRCIIEFELATLHTVNATYEQASEWATQGLSHCEEDNLHLGRVYEVQNQINYGLLASYREQGDLIKAQTVATEARETARRGWQIGIRDRYAQALLATESLTEQFREGKAVVQVGTAPIPVELQRYTMPQNGDWGDALVTHPGAEVSFQVSLPEEPTYLGFRTAMDPQSWGWGGDGSTFVIQLRTNDGTPMQEVFRQYVGNTPADQHWHEWQLSLEAYTGQTITLTFLTEPGPQENFVGDWAGWEGLYILPY